MAACCLCSGPALSAPAAQRIDYVSALSSPRGKALRRDCQLPKPVCSSFSEVFGTGIASELRCKSRPRTGSRSRALNVTLIVGALAPELEDSRLLIEAPSILGLVKGAESKVLPNFRWRRVLLKVSGEALAGDGSNNIDPKVTMSIAREVAAITRLGVEVAIVVGGGNFFRGAAWVGSSGLDRASADHIGMMATVMNAIFLQASMESIGVPTRVMTAFRMAEVAEPYIRRRAVRHLEKGRVVIFGAGTGNPFFTTDTAAALRAAEINAEVVLKATNVDGVYDKDPRKNPDATLLDRVSYREVAIQGLSVMDITAITLCQENRIPVVVFNLGESGNITKALSGERIGTLIDNQGCDHFKIPKATEIQKIPELEKNPGQVDLSRTFGPLRVEEK